VGIRPFILGDDLSGIVVETGSEVTKFEVGDEVLAKDTTLMGGLWPLGSCITRVNSLDRDKWLAVVRCLYWISSKGSGYPAYTSETRQDSLQ
jgi:NADPH:quinone reductase-like Zn-dependent oxidoreductase